MGQGEYTTKQGCRIGAMETTLVYRDGMYPSVVPVIHLRHLLEGGRFTARQRQAPPPKTIPCRSACGKWFEEEKHEDLHHYFRHEDGADKRWRLVDKGSNVLT